MGCNYSQHEIDLYYVPSPILDCNWIIAQCRGNTWKEFEGQNTLWLLFKSSLEIITHLPKLFIDATKEAEMKLKPATA